MATQELGTQPNGVEFGYCWCGCGQRPGLAQSNKANRGEEVGKPWRYVKGHTPGTGPKAKPLAERLAAKLKEAPSGCLEWTPKSRRNGYGSIFVPGRGQVGAHRLAWELRFGPVPPGMFVLHRCDNRLCCNTDHLFLGTRADNAADRNAKGRTASGEQHGMSRLRADDINSIRAEIARGDRLADIAQRHGVSRPMISQIKAGRAWRSVAA